MKSRICDLKSFFTLAQFAHSIHLYTSIAGASRVTFAYEFVPDENNIEKIHFHHRGQTVYNQYGYNDWDRLTRADYPVNVLTDEYEAFAMDEAGNRRSTTLRGGFQAYFVFGNYIDEVLLRHAIPAQAPNHDLYYAHDHLYSPVALLDDTGDIIERCEYDAYGQVQILSSGFSVLGSSQYENPYTFTGRERDTLDVGSCTLYYYRATTYDPQIGRFMQRDPLGIDPAGGKENPYAVQKQYTDGMNLYEYVNSNTQIYIDPDGKSIQNIIDGVAKFFGCGIFIYCRNNEIMPWPIKYIDHCHPVIGPFDGYNGGPGMTKPDAKVYPVVVIRSGMIQYGPAAGKPCECATCGDIRACVAKGRNIGYHGIWPYLRGRNCQGATAKAIMGCCLRSKWRPSAPIAELEPGYEPYPPRIPSPDPTVGIGPCFP